MYTLHIYIYVLDMIYVISLDVKYMYFVVHIMFDKYLG